VVAKGGGSSTWKLPLQYDRQQVPSILCKKDASLYVFRNYGIKSQDYTFGEISAVFSVPLRYGRFPRYEAPAFSSLRSSGFVTHFPEAPLHEFHPTPICVASQKCVPKPELGNKRKKRKRKTAGGPVGQAHRLALYHDAVWMARFSRLRVAGFASVRLIVTEVFTAGFFRAFF